MLAGTRQLMVVIDVELAYRDEVHPEYKLTGRITAADDFKVLERGEIRELGRKRRGDSREGQLPTRHPGGRLSRGFG
jgi:hypothetical protein